MSADGICTHPGCERDHMARGLCGRHYQQSRRQERRDIEQGTLEPVVVTCPNDLLPLVAELVENDARPIFRLLWRAIGEWHLAGSLEEEAS